MKKILINFPSQTFSNHSIRIINELYKKNEIVFIIDDYYIQPNQKLLVKKLFNEKKIYDFFQVPKSRIFKSYTDLKYIKKIEKKLINHDFDYYITSLNTSVISKYICNKILKKKCKKIVFNIGIPQLIRYKNFNQVKNYRKLKKKYSLYELYLDKLSNFYKSENKEKLIKIFNFLKFVNLKLKNNINNLFNFYILPLILTGEIYKPSSLEIITHIYPKDVDLLLVDNNFEKKIFKKFIKNIKIEVAKLDQNNCHCLKKKKKYPNGLLSCLSWPLLPEKLPNKFYEDYIRDFKIIIKKMSINEIHLRPHPEQIFRWEKKLEKEIKKLGVKVKIIGRSNGKYGVPGSLREIICDYKVTAGFTSGAMREARDYCDISNVVVFEKVSRYETNQSEDPKKIYNHINGIEYINYEGVYEKKISLKKPKYKNKVLVDFIL